jgi:hypothetical protein
VHFTGWDTVVFQGKGNVLSSAQPHKLAVRILQYRANDFGDVKNVEIANILVKKEETAGTFPLKRMGYDPVNTMDQGGLART